jgi:hypothetical protein
MKKEVILSSAYLAPVEYYTKLFAYDTIHIEQFDHYMKQTYRNRCTIASADGSLSLTIPTEKSDDLKCLMKDVRISDHGNWRHVHWNAFVAAYKQSPFFDYYADEFHRFYEHRYEFLFDFNMELCNWICEQIDLHPSFVMTKDYVANVEDMDDFPHIYIILYYQYCIRIYFSSIGRSPNELYLLFTCIKQALFFSISQTTVARLTQLI